VKQKKRGRGRGKSEEVKKGGGEEKEGARGKRRGYGV
jgi:hypothetical protein